VKGLPRLPGGQEEAAAWGLLLLKGNHPAAGEVPETSALRDVLFGGVTIVSDVLGGGWRRGFRG
jgi:hypothetical protein